MGLLGLVSHYSSLFLTISLLYSLSVTDWVDRPFTSASQGQSRNKTLSISSRRLLSALSGVFSSTAERLTSTPTRCFIFPSLACRTQFVAPFPARANPRHTTVCPSDRHRGGVGKFRKRGGQKRQVKILRSRFRKKANQLTSSW